MPSPLDYQHRSSDIERPSMLTVLLLALPGFVCWCLLASALLNLSSIRAPPLLPNNAMLFIGLLSWPVAFFCALISLYRYGSGRKPWYVWLNFAINGSGLLFTGGFFLLPVISKLRT